MPSENYIDRSSGNGSRSIQEDWIDENTTAQENEWTSSRTTFYPDDAPEHLERRYRRLREWHDNKWSSERKHELKQAMIINDTKTFATILDLDEADRDRVLHIMKESDISSNNFSGKSYEKIILAVCTLVDDESRSRDVENEEIFHSRAAFSEEFEALLETVDMDRGEHKRIRQMVREKTEFGDT